MTTTNRKQQRATRKKSRQANNKICQLPKEPESTAAQSVPERTLEEIEHLVALFNQGRYAEADVFALKITERFPNNGFGWKALGAVFTLQGRTVESLEPMQKAAALLPEDVESQYNLGVTLLKLGRPEEAEAAFRRALKIKPDFAEAHFNLGYILSEFGLLEEAETSCRLTLEIKPNYAEAHNNLGVTLNDLGRLEEAEASYRRALEIKPDYAEAHNNLGITLKDLGLLNEAEASYRRALEIKPNYSEAHNNLGITLKDMGHMEEAEASYRAALEIKPDYAEAHNNLGNILKELGRLEEAEVIYRRSLQIRPDWPEAHSNLLLTLNYADTHNLSYLLEEARRYGQMVSKKAGTRFGDWHCTPRPIRLRVGLVSGDLHSHPVGYFLKSVLVQIDQSRLELIAYSTDTKADGLTTSIKPYFSVWKSLAGLNDEAAARLIHSDGIHILLDLSGHTSNNRLPLFAWKPAPVQATWLGYLATTGVAEMDYLIGDLPATPQENDVYLSEYVWRLPDIWGCFSPPEVELEVNRLPALSAGYITFGCFNNLTKMNDAVVALWARVLQSVRGSRLFLKTRQLDNPAVCETTRQRFAAHGIEPGKLILEGAVPRAELLAAYHRVDIALDPFPYTGGTTNFEALWMAVPFVTRKGDGFISRGGQSILCNAGLYNWIAENDDDYVAKAVIHAADPERLASLRTALRRKVLDAPLFDAPRFARHLETALWGMWERWQSR